MEAGRPANEAERLRSLHELDVLDTPAEEVFDRITRLAAAMFGAPIALVSLIDDERQWTKSAVGIDRGEAPREIAFCSHAILQPDVFVVPDARADDRFRENPFVVEAPNLRFYAGAPLVVDRDIRLGTLCAIDKKPRDFTPRQQQALRDLAAVVVDELRLRRLVKQRNEANRLLAAQAVELRHANEALEQFAHMASHDLRSPLKTIINMAGIAKRSADEGTGTHLDYIEDAARGLERIVIGYGRLSQLRCGKKTSIPLSELAADALARANVSLNVAIESDEAIRCDRVLLTLALTNLISNAARYGSEPELRFSATLQDNEVVVQAENPVKASFPVDASIFAPFHRLSSKEGGSGLGLAIVHRVSQLHDGTVHASCDDARFCVELRLPK